VSLGRATAGETLLNDKDLTLTGPKVGAEPAYFFLVSHNQGARSCHTCGWFLELVPAGQKLPSR